MCQGTKWPPKTLSATGKSKSEALTVAGWMLTEYEHDKFLKMIIEDIPSLPPSSTVHVRPCNLWIPLSNPFNTIARNHDDVARLCDAFRTAVTRNSLGMWNPQTTASTSQKTTGKQQLIISLKFRIDSFCEAAICSRLFLLFASRY